MTTPRRSGRPGRRRPRTRTLGSKLGKQLTLIATCGDAPVGFASLKDGDHIDMLYVHPSAAGQGVGALL